MGGWRAEARVRPSIVGGNQSCEIGPHRHAGMLPRLLDPASSRGMVLGLAPTLFLTIVSIMVYKWITLRS
jgi:hypothetical protein